MKKFVARTTVCWPLLLSVVYCRHSTQQRSVRPGALVRLRARIGGMVQYGRGQHGPTPVALGAWARVAAELYGSSCAAFRSSAVVDRDDLVGYSEVLKTLVFLEDSTLRRREWLSLGRPRLRVTVLRPCSGDGKGPKRVHHEANGLAGAKAATEGGRRFSSALAQGRLGKDAVMLTEGVWDAWN
jgi:hypothetical protein